MLDVGEPLVVSSWQSVDGTYRAYGPATVAIYQTSLHVESTQVNTKTRVAHVNT